MSIEKLKKEKEAIKLKLSSKRASFDNLILDFKQKFFPNENVKINYIETNEAEISITYYEENTDILNALFIISENNSISIQQRINIHNTFDNTTNTSKNIEFFYKSISFFYENPKYIIDLINEYKDKIAYFKKLTLQIKENRQDIINIININKINKIKLVFPLIKNSNLEGIIESFQNESKSYIPSSTEGASNLNLLSYDFFGDNVKFNKNRVLIEKKDNEITYYIKNNKCSKEDVDYLLSKSFTYKGKIVHSIPDLKLKINVSITKKGSVNLMSLLTSLKTDILQEEISNF